MANPTARHPADAARHRWFDSYDFPAESANFAYVMGSAKARAVRITRAALVVTSTVAANVSNFVTVSLFNVTTAQTVASWSTSTVGQGALTGGVPAELVLGTAANLDLLVGHVYEFKVAVTGTGTITAGRFRLEGFEL